MPTLVSPVCRAKAEERAKSFLVVVFFCFRFDLCNLGREGVKHSSVKKSTQSE
jgi:hypothetical protein